MHIKSILTWITLVNILFSSESFGGKSFYTARLDDPHAVYLTKDDFSVNADGTGDDTAALQAAIDKASDTRAGIVFIPEGTYLLSNTIYVWPGVRLIGYGARRPVFKLGENTPGYQGEKYKYMLFFSGGRGRNGGSPRDGNPGTFYSAMSSIDIEIGPGNPAAIGVRFHVAQHCYLSHIDFRLGSARAGLDDFGNEVEDLHFYGGQYGITSGRSAPGWPLLAIDCTFEGQSVAALGLEKSGLTLVRPQIRNVPTAVEIFAEQFDELWISDARFENVTGPALVISNEYNPCNQINLQNIACQNVPVLAGFRRSGRKVEGKGRMYVVEQFSHGLHIESLGAKKEIKTTYTAKEVDSLPEPVKTDIPELPACQTWVNVSTLGIIGDANTDNTATLRDAVAKYRTLYFPMGLYNISDTITLKPDTILIALHPSMTVINIPDETPAFQGSGAPKPVIEAQKGGTNIITGIGIYTGAVNARAVAVKWMAGADSMMNDVRFHGGHGTYLRTGGRNWRRSRDVWNSQPASLWVTDGGGGTFKDIWTPNVFAKSGMLITNTSTSGRLYAMSSEHHVKNEMIIRNSSNWKFYALQFEEEREEGPEALPLEIDNSSNMQFTNTFFYRVISCFVPYPYAVKVTNSRDIRFRNFHCYSNSRVAFDSAVYEPDLGIEVRDHEFALLDVSSDIKPAFPKTGTVVLAEGAKVEKLADGFLNIAGAAVNSKGELYFSDARELKIYRWSKEDGKAEVIREVAERPVVLAFDKADDLIVVAYEGNGTVLSFDPEDANGEIAHLEPQPAQPRQDMVAYLPVNRWSWADDETFVRNQARQKEFHYICPDGTTFIPAGSRFTTGATSWGVKTADLIRAFRLEKVMPGQNFYVTDEANLKTFSFTAGPDGTLSDGKLFVEDGGESIAIDDRGNVYLAAGHIYVFDPSGKKIDSIKVPQRPISIVFGGVDKKTLFITARSSLYGVRTKFAGR
jgi:hypothetical protein